MRRCTGAAEMVVQPAMATMIQQSCPGFRMSKYAQTGHAPFFEDAPRFNLELAQFA